MRTETLYYEDPYAQTGEAEVLSVTPRGGNVVLVVLDRTVFYPEGGGQPADQGEITTETGSVKINTVRTQGDEIVHEGKLTGEVSAGQTASLQVKWPRRIKYMRIHSAGHLIHDVLTTERPDLVAIKGKHGDKAFLEYKGILNPDQREDLESKVNEAIASALPIRTWESNYDELTEICKTVPDNLPKNKPLRVLRIGEYDAMPDGGVQVSDSTEIGSVVIHHVTNEDGKTTIRYGVTN